LATSVLVLLADYADEEEFKFPRSIIKDCFILRGLSVVIVRRKS